jgi:hypothetical protein
MKILLQNVLNRMYFRRPGVWTADSASAHDFKDAQAVFDFVEEQNMHDVQLVVKVGDTCGLEIVPLELAPAVARAI